MAHIHDKVDFTVEVFIVHKNKVLLRLHDKYKIWLSVGGHIELHEDPTEAAIKEEVGLDVKLLEDAHLFPPVVKNGRALSPPRFINRHNISPAHEHVVFIYFASTESTDVVEPENEQSGGCTWATKEDLENMDLLPEIKFYAARALDELSSL